MDIDRCVCCGEYVPEGTMVCYKCNKQYENTSTNQNNDYIMSINVYLETFNDVNNFVKYVSVCEDDVLAHSNQYTVSAKSIMGMYSLDLSNPIKVEFYGDVPYEVKDGMKKFIIN